MDKNGHFTYPMSRNPPWIFYRSPHHPPLIAPNTAATVVMSEELMLLVAKILIFFFLVRPTWRQTALVFRSIIKGLQKVTNWMATRNWLFELINQSYLEEFQFESIWNCDSKWLFVGSYRVNQNVLNDHKYFHNVFYAWCC